MCAAPLAAPPAQADPATSTDGVYTAANRNYAAAAGRELLHGSHTARAARAHMRAEIHDLPADQRPFFAVGPLRGSSFTIRVVADYACLSATPSARTVRPGACRRDDALTKQVPLRTAALSVDVLHVSALDTSFPSTYWHGLDPRRLATFASSAAPTGGRAAGITDRDDDGLDDDGRVTFRRGGSAVCLELPLDNESSTRVVNTACGDLPARSTHDMSKAVQRAQLLDATKQVAEQVQQSLERLESAGQRAHRRRPDRHRGWGRRLLQHAVVPPHRRPDPADPGGAGARGHGRSGRVHRRHRRCRVRRRPGLGLGPQPVSTAAATWSARSTATRRCSWVG